MIKMRSRYLFLLIGVILIAGCNLPSAQQVIEMAATEDLNAVLTEVAANIEPTAVPLPTETPKPLETLNICLGKEPQSLFFYAESSRAMWSVLESIYDGPFDSVNGESVPVIFDAVNVEKESVPVIAGDVIMDSTGMITAIKPNTRFTPSNPLTACGSETCEVVWNNEAKDVEMFQTVITYRLKPGLKWSDGEALTAEDSVFSMKINGDSKIKADKSIYNLTDSYKAEDELTIVWRGIPGYHTEDASEPFWLPLPKHQLEGMKAEELLASDLVNKTPLGWGAWQISEWIPGEQITAERNPYYLSSDGTQPYFDRVVYRFYGKAGDNNLQALASGSCDIIDTSVDLSIDLEPILEDVRDGKLSVYIRPELTRRQLTFGIDSLKEGRKPNYTDYFKTAEVRKAIAQCIDRNALNRQVLYGQSEIPVDFWPSDHVSHTMELETVPYDPEIGKKTLIESGWVESVPGGTLTAGAVPGVIAGTPFELELVTTESADSQKTAEMIRENLADCGISLTIDPQPLGKLYGQGPEGLLFGRKFDLALFSWSAMGDTPWSIYESCQIPTAENNWIGANVGGFNSETYETALQSGEGIIEAFTAEFPEIPLLFDLSIGASNNTTCGITDTIGSRSMLWNMESFTRSETPCAVSQWKNIYQ